MVEKEENKKLELFEIAELVEQAIDGFGSFGYGSRTIWFKIQGKTITFELDKAIVKDTPEKYYLDGKEVSKEEYLEKYPEEA